MDEDFYKLDTLLDVRPLHLRSKLPLPKKIGPYKIESLLNQGGMSLLYLGIHPTTSEPIAIKVLLPKYLKNKEINARFLNEAKIIEGAQHPNIVKLYDAGTWENGLYIAMEFIRGVSLRQFIQKTSFSLKKALEIMIEVAYAIEHLHSHGIIHRDLKPENILITDGGAIKLIDFGIAQLQNEIHKDVDPKKMGTPFYMSPEQLENPSDITPCTDIYAIGIIAYELILGKSTHGIVHLELLPPALRVIIEKTLEINPKLRYQNLVDFVADISQYLKDFESKIKEPTDLFSNAPYSTEHIRSILMPKKGIRSPQLEIALSIESGALPGCPYFDFFPLSNNRLAIVLAESTQLDSISLVHTSVLRGMVRMMMENAFQNEKKGQKPEDLIHSLNEAICKDPRIEKFQLSMLFLNPEKNSLSFISCDYTDLWHLEEGSKKVKELSTPNPALGNLSNTTLIGTTDNWNSGDMIILHSKKEMNHPIEEIFDLIATEHKLLSAQHLANKLKIQLIKNDTLPLERTSVVLAVHRIF